MDFACVVAIYNRHKLLRQPLKNLLNKQNQVAILLATGNSQIRFLDTLIALGEID